jgi:hypothetical protein
MNLRAKLSPSRVRQVPNGAGDQYDCARGGYEMAGLSFKGGDLDAGLPRGLIDAGVVTGDSLCI